MFQMINPFTFTTERFLVRFVDINDYDDYFELCSSSQVTRYLTFEPYQNIKDAKKVITNMIRAFYAGECVNFSIVEKITNKVIGSISLTFFQNNNKSEIGYLINEHFQNQKVMSEILPVFIKYTFDYYNVDSIYARVVKENEISIHLLEKNNFKYMHTLLNGVKMHHQIKDVYFFELYKSNYLKKF